MEQMVVVEEEEGIPMVLNVMEVLVLKVEVVVLLPMDIIPVVLEAEVQVQLVTPLQHRGDMAEMVYIIRILDGVLEAAVAAEHGQMLHIIQVTLEQVL
jgi:hypothetical protein